MNKEQITNQLELYSNVIVGFVVIQSLTFSFNFGMNDKFNNILRTYKSLAIGLTAMFVISMLLALYANHFISSRQQQFGSEHCDLIKAMYRGKAIVIIMFSAMLISVTVSFAVFGAIPNK